LIACVSGVCLWRVSLRSVRDFRSQTFRKGAFQRGCHSRLAASPHRCAWAVSSGSCEAHGCPGPRLQSHVVWNARELIGSGASESYRNMLGPQVRSTTTSRSFRSFLVKGEEPVEIVCRGRTKNCPTEVGMLGGGRSGGLKLAVRNDPWRTLPMISKRQKQARSEWTSCASHAVRPAPPVNRSSRVVGNSLPQRRPLAKVPNKFQTASRVFARSDGPLDRRHRSTAWIAQRRVAACIASAGCLHSVRFV